AVVGEATWLVRIIQFRKTIMTAGLVLTVLAAWGALQVGFSYNMLKLQAKEAESVVWEERILSKSGRSGFAALATASSLEDLERKSEAFAALPSVSKVESVLMLTPDRQSEKIGLIRQFAPLVERIRVAVAPSGDRAHLRGPLEALQRRLRLATEEGSEQAQREVGPVQAKLQALRQSLPHADVTKAGLGLAQLERQTAQDFADKLKRFQENLTPQPVHLGEAPPELRQSYIGESGRYLLRIHP